MKVTNLIMLSHSSKALNQITVQNGGTQTSVWLQLTASTPVTITYTSNGEKVSNVYSDLSSATTIVLTADLNSTIKIVGDVSVFYTERQYLPEIDTSRCATLEEAMINTTRDLTILKLNAELVRLCCNSNEALTTLDLTRCTRLSYMEIQSSKFMSLDVSHCMLGDIKAQDAYLTIKPEADYTSFVAGLSPTAAGPRKIQMYASAANRAAIEQLVAARNWTVYAPY